MKRLSAHDALGISFLGQTVKSMKSLPALGVLTILFFSAAYVMAKIGVWAVLGLAWIGMAAVLYRLRGRLKLRNISAAMRVKDQDAAEVRPSSERPN